MKSFAFICLFAATMPLTGCQSFQFVESPIPVKNISSQTVLVESISATTTPTLVIPAKGIAPNTIFIY
ncbi:hypothetical protein [Psychrobacter sp. ANT_WB68]|uniref:hypothetical protein n=1 Tax=Psychrobacter sp. ANT_WB68 TaxID=2597355 RepID=UPI0011F10ADE|nr:hypothetical protein [Psychrobacter sp. ANT_WB68]KAA0914378.1 hypothetical protein FQ084_07355 [Psychrobacter sp. ANT_WB68]